MVNKLTLSGILLLLTGIAFLIATIGILAVYGNYIVCEDLSCTTGQSINTFLTKDFIIGIGMSIAGLLLFLEGKAQ